MDILREQQEAFDNGFFDPPNGYMKLCVRDKKIAHIGMHLGKIPGRKVLHWASDGGEELEKINEVRTEVIPDLMIYRTQFANITDLDDEQLDKAALEFTNPAFQPTRRHVHSKLVEAGGRISDYIEPLMHGETAPLRLIGEAALMLHASVVRLGEIYGLTSQLEDLHRQRLAEQASRHSQTTQTLPASGVYPRLL